jgi:hypothetical protein
MRLRIQLLPKWRQSEDPEGPATFGRDDGVGAFQVSWAEYRGGKLPTDVTAESLMQMVERFGEQNSFGQMIESSGGECRYGMYGTGVFHAADHPRIQAWYISDGRDFIMATHFCDEEPDPSEIAEVQQIAASLALGP